jgi:hypothetical protein
MIPVQIKGTPMTFTIPASMISLNMRPGYYVPGSIIVHEVIGKIRCEEVYIGEDMTPSRVICSIVDQKSIRTARTR